MVYSPNKLTSTPVLTPSGGIPTGPNQNMSPDIMSGVVPQVTYPKASDVAKPITPLSSGIPGTGIPSPAYNQNHPINVIDNPQVNNPQGVTPEAFKQLLVTAHPNDVAKDGRKYADIPAYEITKMVVDAHPNDVTKAGIPYKDYLVAPRNREEAFIASGSKLGKSGGNTLLDNPVWDYIDSKANNAAQRLQKDFTDTVDSTENVVGGLLKAGEKAINKFTGMPNSFDNPSNYAPAQEGLDKGIQTNTLQAINSGWNTVLDAVPNTAAVKAGFDVTNDIPGVNLVNKAISGAMNLGSEGLQAINGMKKEDADALVGILGDYMLTKGGEAQQVRFNNIYQEHGLPTALAYSGFQIPQTVINTALTPFKFGQYLYGKILDATNSARGNGPNGGGTGPTGDTGIPPNWNSDLKPQGVSSQDWKAYQASIGRDEIGRPISGFKPPITKTQEFVNNRVEKKVASSWKIPPKLGSEIEGLVGESAAKFALENGYVGKDTEASSQLAENGKNNLMAEKANTLADWGETDKTPAMQEMAQSLLTKLDSNTSIIPGGSSAKLQETIQAAKDFLTNTKPTFSQIDALKSLYDNYNPDGLSWDAQGRLVDPGKHEDAGFRRGQVQSIIEAEGEKRGIDIAGLNKKIMATQKLIRGLDRRTAVMHNNNLISLGDTQLAIMGSVLGGDIAGIATLLVKKGFGAEATTGFLAKHFYTPRNENIVNGTNRASATSQSWVERFSNHSDTVPNIPVDSVVRHNYTELQNNAADTLIKLKQEIDNGNTKSINTLLNAFKVFKDSDMAVVIKDYPELNNLKIQTEMINKALESVPKAVVPGQVIPEAKIAEAIDPIISGIHLGEFSDGQLKYIGETAPKEAHPQIAAALNEDAGIPPEATSPETPTKPTEPTKPEPTPISKPEMVQSIFDSIKNDGGATYNMQQGSLGGKPFVAVAPFPDRSMIIDANKFTKSDLAHFIRKNVDLLKNPDFSIGGWHDTESGKIYLDVSVTIPKEKLDMAKKLGELTDQKSIFDLEHFNEISTGGKGEKSTLSDEQVLQFLKGEYNPTNDKNISTSSVGTTVNPDNGGKGTPATSGGTGGTAQKGQGKKGGGEKVVKPKPKK